MEKTQSKKCLVEGSFIPGYAHSGDAGADLCSAVSVTIPARGKALVSTGIRIALPSGTVGLIWPRSGLAVRDGIDTGAGVIDSGYRGEVKVLLFNHSDTDFEIGQGDRIAQLLAVKCEQLQFESVATLEATERGDGGFGSTGKR
ncbi:MAG: dUTP diphosphatase [Nitrospinae bacterium CG11_big_fil_rev_8_21_14_0_20_45_15]|nr:MAG: dUTP diphosphatase [Nitrospinae bacterium CG11_big_fil_rev_8_21_14_0_20_45_15]